MDELFTYLDELSERAAGIDRLFSQALTGSKEGAISQGRNSAVNPLVSASRDFGSALMTRNLAINEIAVDITRRSVALAEQLTGEQPDTQQLSLIERHRDFTLQRLSDDAARRVGQYQLDMKRIVMLARSMRERNDWDASASLLRARESVDNRPGVSVDSAGRKQHSERYTRLHVRGLGLATLVDMTVMLSDADSFEVRDFSGEVMRTIGAEEYPDLRDDLFHPQAHRYLAPNRK